jgi:hypothetical protein
MAAVVGKPRTWSPSLRPGLADAVAFLGGYAADQILHDGATGKLYARRLVAAPNSARYVRLLRFSFLILKGRFVTLKP